MKIKKAGLVCVLMIMSVCFVSGAPGAQIQVPGDYPTIQEAIDSAVYGDVIQVAAGTYAERIVLKAGTTLEGAGSDVTFLDGGGRGPIVWVPDSARANSTFFRGFTVQNGYDGIYRSDEGATSGIYIDWLGSATIEHNVIHSQGDYGIFLGYGYVDTIIRKNRIHGNKRYAIADYNGRPMIENNIIYDCDWGGIESWNPASKPSIRNNTIVNNIGTGWGKGVVFGNGSIPQIFENNIIAYNGGPGIFLYSHNDLTLPLRLFYNAVYGNGTPHNENIILDPDTCVADDPLLTNIAAHDYTFLEGSPCVDAGNPAIQFNDSDGSRNDMGAYGGNGTISGNITPPYAYRSLPGQIKAVPRTASIEIIVSDYDPGVDMDTLVLDLNGVRIFDGSNPGAYPDTVWSGTSSGYTITYAPAVPYLSGERMNLTANCRDLSGNAMPQYGFSFIVEVYDPRQINVPEDFPTIQAAVDEARFGDTVSVGVGLFNGNVVLKDGVILSGAGPYFSIIKGQGGNSVIDAKDDSVVQGFSIDAERCAYAVYFFDASGEVRNNLMASNSNLGSYGGVFASLWSNPRIINNTIVGFSNGIILGGDQSVVLKNNIVAFCLSRGVSNNGASAVFEYNNVYGSPVDYSGYSPGFNDICVDPGFADLQAGNYTLLASSDCVDAGHPDPENNDTDGSRNDMGAFGGPNRVNEYSGVMDAIAASFGRAGCTDCQGDMDADQDMDGEDLTVLSRNFGWME